MWKVLKSFQLFSALLLVFCFNKFFSLSFCQPERWWRASPSLRKHHHNINTTRTTFSVVNRAWRGDGKKMRTRHGATKFPTWCKFSIYTVFQWNTHQTLVWSIQHRALRLLQKPVVFSRQCIEQPQQRESIVESFLLFAGCWIITLSSCHVLILFGNPRACDSLELNFHSRYLSHTSLSDDDFHHIFMSRNIRIYVLIPSSLHHAPLLLSLSHYLVVEGSNDSEIFPHIFTF